MSVKECIQQMLFYLWRLEKELKNHKKELEIMKREVHTTQRQAQETQDIIRLYGEEQRKWLEKWGERTYNILITFLIGLLLYIITTLLHGRL